VFTESKRKGAAREEKKEEKEKINKYVPGRGDLCQKKRGERSKRGGE